MKELYMKKLSSLKKNIEEKEKEDLQKIQNDLSILEDTSVDFSKLQSISTQNDFIIKKEFKYKLKDYLIELKTKTEKAYKSLFVSIELFQESLNSQDEDVYKKIDNFIANFS